mmetsp:Transcript_19350/g.32538  ORF Transcript_19350/g.32538 Transcript_19350/m.32538 type:complete len:383 (+) Transcript_19350:113-1261(+)
MKILVTAPPNTGKSTLMRTVVTSLTTRNIKTCRGVLTTENRDSTGIRRVGFTAQLSDGRKADFMIKKKRQMNDEEEVSGEVEPEVRVGSYVVQLSVIDELVVPFLKSIDDDFHGDDNLVYVDEIGRAQAHSSEFLQTVERILKNTSQCVLGSVVLAENTWSRVFKEQVSVWLIEVTLDNRDQLSSILEAMYISSALFSSLQDTDQRYLKAMFFELLHLKMFVAARKLFKNTVKYVLDGKVTRVARALSSDGDSGAGTGSSTYDCDDEVYEVKGDTNDHFVHMTQWPEKLQTEKVLPLREEDGTVFSSITHRSGDELEAHDTSAPSVRSSWSSCTVLQHVDLFSCDCPLFCGEGPFAGQPQLCSHILAVYLCRHQASQQPSIT